MPFDSYSGPMPQVATSMAAVEESLVLQQEVSAMSWAVLQSAIRWASNSEPTRLRYEIEQGPKGLVRDVLLADQREVNRAYWDVVKKAAADPSGKLIGHLMEHRTADQEKDWAYVPKEVVAKLLMHKEKSVRELGAKVIGKREDPRARAKTKIQKVFRNIGSR